ncbi:MAG: ABC transporter substrate-binding protein [Promethearchaeota archaeon]|jgi:ABC-type transport system substrate-binding protein
MKNRLKKIFIIVLLMTAILPSLGIFGIAEKPKTAQGSTISFVCGITYGAADWDPPIYISTPNNYYLWASLETLVWTDFNGDAHPVLATSWTIYPRLDEGGHTGGVKAIAFSLRQGVEFHDNSEWNATVAKWNIDRAIDISGNQSGTGDFQNRDLFWMDTSQWKDEFTPNWNLSWAVGNDVFGLGDEIPNINKTEVINDYTLNVTFNAWTYTVGAFEGAYFNMISMESYSDWSAAPIYGVGEHIDFPQDNPSIFPGHMIGTGPYKFDFIDEAVTATGHLIKNDNYWNGTLLEADDLFSITDVYVRHFADTESRTTALLTGEIDYCSDLMQIAITDHTAVLADPLLDYVPVQTDGAIIDITFKCEEGLNTPTPLEPPFWGLTPKELFEINFGFPMPDGVNRTVRRALSYSFDYETYFNVAQEGWGNLSQSCLGIESQYYNPSVAEPYYDVSKAREILLSDPYYAGLATNRSLSLSNSTAEWNAVALSNPIDTHNMIHNTDSDEPTFMEAALNDIGFGFIGIPDPDIWQNQVATGLAVLYDMFPFVWPNDPLNPWGFMNAFFTSKNRVIPYAGYNFNFLANDTIDALFTDIYFSANPQPLYDQLAYDLQNYHVPFLYLSQYQIGFGINKGWDFAELMPERIGFSGLPYYAWIGGDRLTATTLPQIPGYNLYLISFISSIAIFSAIYVLIRKKRLN